MLTLRTARDPKWSNAEKTSIDLVVSFEENFEAYGEMPFTASPDDSAEHGRSIYEQAVAGAFGEVEAFTAPVLSVEQVGALINAERDRRIDAGVTFQGVMYQSAATDRENIAGAAQLAFMAMVAGAQAGDLRWSNPEEDFTWIASDNSLVPMDAPTVVAFGKAAAGAKQALIKAGRALKDVAPTPTDYTDDRWWV